MNKDNEKDMKIALIYNNDQRDKMGDRCFRVLKKYNNLDLYHFNLRGIQGIKEDFDLYLRIGCDNDEIIYPDLHPIGWWINDTHLKHNYKAAVRMVNNYDYVFCAQKEGAEQLTKDTGKKTYWIPWATDELPPNFRFPNEEEKRWDICFIGSKGKYSLRRVVLEMVKSHFDNIYIGRAPVSELRDYYSKARIVVNYSINNDINPRIFEGAGAGALVLTHRIKDNGFSEIFEEGKHLVVYDDIINEMKDKIGYYLTHVKKRTYIAKNGFDYVNENHAFRHRVKEIFKIMGYKLGK